MANFDYYQFRIKNITEKINEEIDFYQQCQYADSEPVIKYIGYLKNRIGTDKYDPATYSHYDKAGVKQEIKQMKMDEYIKDIDISTFSRPWIKLREIHKMMKISEFVDNLTYDESKSKNAVVKNRKEIKEEIQSGIKGKKFGKNKNTIKYNEEKMSIESISCLEYNKETMLYEIEWD